MVLIKKSKILSILYSVIPGLLLGCTLAESGTGKTPLVGGPCQYRSYPGQAEIISVSKSESVPVSAVERYDVKFRFIPDGPIEEPFARVEERSFSLLPDRVNPPGRAFIEKFDIRPGKRYDCILQVIKKGTCTPLIFDFPSLTGGAASPR
ncbi:MAG TPA: hypothetical protein PLR20_06820 [Syntrophales bacterium]|nr:hypothetical protein [Syntrophales bacterium]HPI56231.1 hypothetical protein [Syntrophales bacterium]HPN24418.1 hypothetical protein [Syntrophales bacterium]HQM29048.1 hypothetical protein [Syntrophales bacterium]